MYAKADSNYFMIRAASCSVRYFLSMICWNSSPPEQYLNAFQMIRNPSNLLQDKEADVVPFPDLLQLDYIGVVLYELVICKENVPVLSEC